MDTLPRSKDELERIRLETPWLWRWVGPAPNRETSMAAYDHMHATGAISLARWEVYETVFWLGPLTSGEFFDIARQRRIGNPHPLSQTRARFTELRQMGLLYELPTRPCRISGRACIEWDVTALMEPDPDAKTRHTKRRSVIRELKERVLVLEQENGELRSEVVRLRRYQPERARLEQVALEAFL